ncbi:hypothetical protein M011DRAFT_457083 [Sporormia fimetaria CBS 119925]|uniref:Rhodopsin domain-containing protein n=1 Tax=Sporormia fimetaria CBS 119925 TaxID=1340428 RepID=A0A6A6VID1_9PLEO|nr:hypothetical protein M011DRAFT_457083 [Sporormia fimetaria CBS 119925]
MPTYPLQVTCLAVIAGTPALAAVFVALRIYTRRKLNLRLGLDDWLVVLPLLLSIALIGPSFRHVHMWHTGVHIWDVDPRDIEPDYDEWYGIMIAFNLLNIPILPLVKASIIFLLLRAGSVIEWLKKVLYFILAFTVLSALIPWFLYIFICPPQTGNTWKPRTFGGLHCIGRPQMGSMLLWVTCANLLTDLLIFPIPFIIVRRMMSARLRSRLVVLAVFTSSLAVTAIGAAKIYLQYRDRLYTLFQPDWTYPIDYCINHIENNVAIIVANVPILRGLVTRWVFNFRTKATPVEREAACNSDWQWNSSANSSAFTRVARRHRIAQKILPCIQDDFSSSLARSGDFYNDPKSPSNPNYPARIITKPRTHKSKPGKSKVRRNSTPDTVFASSDSCEKGDMLETVRSIGSLGSAPTLVDSKELDWKRFSDPGSPTMQISPSRRISSPMMSPISPLAPCVVREVDEDDEDADDGIYPFP